MELTLEKIKNTLTVGEKYTSIGKVRSLLGYSKTGNQKQIERDIKDIERFIEYSSTGKKNPNTGKISNQIVIDRIKYEDEIVGKVDLRGNEYYEWLEPLLLVVPNGTYTTTQLFEKIFYSKFDSKYICHWKWRKKDGGLTRNQKLLLDNLRQRFKSTVMNSMEKLMKQSNTFSYAKLYHLWDGNHYNEGVDTTIRGGYDGERKLITNDDIEKMELDAKEIIMEKYKVEKLTFKMRNEARELAHGDLVKERFGFDNYCMIFNIQNRHTGYLGFDTDDLEYYRINLHWSLMEATAKWCNDKHYEMKDTLKRKTGKYWYPYRHDCLSLKLLDEMAKEEGFAEKYIEIDEETKKKLAELVSDTQQEKQVEKKIVQPKKVVTTDNSPFGVEEHTNTVISQALFADEEKPRWQPNPKINPFL